MSKETSERRLYRKKCRHYSGWVGHCLKRSGGSNGFFIDVCCTPDANCARMRRYDNKIKKMEEE